MSACAALAVPNKSSAAMGKNLVILLPLVISFI
jgi:hypothetical protein